MPIIEIMKLTKDYGNNRGVFDLNLSIEAGEMVGFVGTNGAGKTTTIRMIMGFIKPDKGEVRINGLDSWKDASKIKKQIGYVPGEIAFPDLRSGKAFLKSQAEFLNVTNMSYTNELIEILQLDTTANLKRMSKGMKQKTAIIAAFMADNDILILDEPTTGLDPLMRLAFMNILKKERAKGKTILMSSHMFEELENTCDRVALIQEGRIIDIANMNKIRNRQSSEFKIEFKNKDDYEKFKVMNYTVIRDHVKYNQVTISVYKNDVDSLFKDLANFDVKFVSEIKYTLEKYFREVFKIKREKTI